ncbi:hypothetical protein GCM10010289_30030 [Streptomyces violascens]|uniref:Uncharacterized protein n=1 Tax=Streptomyces violascens TaxID=67381 RepID=A0ABQ3QU52_9ACTN|nr:hypothetical protein GCM10010289_30030 [Streptomyces violascens]GHI40795.1 hypothetical protein Sviol_52030 [Streptomyces violascens]
MRAAEEAGRCRGRLPERAGQVLRLGDAGMCAGDPAVVLAAAWVLLPVGAASRFFEAYGSVDEVMMRRAAGQRSTACWSRSGWGCPHPEVVARRMGKGARVQRPWRKTFTAQVYRSAGGETATAESRLRCPMPRKTR